MAAFGRTFFDQPRGVKLIAATEFWERFSYYGFTGLAALFMAADPATGGLGMDKGLTLKMGQTHVQKYTKPLLEKIEAGEIDPSFVVTHPASLEDAPEMYKKFRDKEDGVIKVVLRP